MSGNRTRGVCVTGRNVTNYTNTDPCIVIQLIHWLHYSLTVQPWPQFCTTSGCCEAFCATIDQKKKRVLWLVNFCFIVDRCAFPWRGTLYFLFDLQFYSTARTVGPSAPINGNWKPDFVLSTSFEKTCMRHFHTFPWMMWLTLIQACFMTKAS